MFESLWKKEHKPCCHPKWEITKEVTFPSIAEQMGVDTLPPEEKMKILATMQPRDFNKSTLMIMSCPFCGEVKEFRATTSFNHERECAHQWDVQETKSLSNFEKTCGTDATFDQRMKVSAKSR